MLQGTFDSPSQIKSSFSLQRLQKPQDNKCSSNLDGFMKCTFSVIVSTLIVRDNLTWCSNKSFKALHVSVRVAWSGYSQLLTLQRLLTPDMSFVQLFKKLENLDWSWCSWWIQVRQLNLRLLQRIKRCELALWLAQNANDLKISTVKMIGVQMCWLTTILKIYSHIFQVKIPIIFSINIIITCF